MTDKPDNPPAMTRGTKAALERICASNGGGVDRLTISPSIFRALRKRGFVQGKMNQHRSEYRIVHTRAGWDAYQAMLAARGRT